MTLNAMRRFEEVTGIKALGGRKHTGSMKPYVSITVSLEDQRVKDFMEAFYSPGDYKRERVLCGIPVTFERKRMDGKRVELDIRWPHLDGLVYNGCEHETVVVKERTLKGERQTHGNRLCTECGSDTRGLIQSDHL